MLGVGHLALAGGKSPAVLLAGYIPQIVSSAAFGHSALFATGVLVRAHLMMIIDIGHT